MAAPSWGSSQAVTCGGCSPAVAAAALPSLCAGLPPAPCPQADAKALFPRFNCGNNTEAGRGLAQLVAQAEGNPRRQALLFRAFLMQFCAGGFYSPFAGDGLT